MHLSYATLTSMRFRDALQLLLSLLLPERPIDSRLRSIGVSELSAHLALTEHLGILSLFSYRDELVREMLLALKFRGKRRMAELFGTILHEVVLEDLAEKKLFTSFLRPLLVAIPLSPARLRERGYNQTLLIAEMFARLAGEEIELAPDALIKIKNTPAQTSLGEREAREQNVRGAFAANAPRVTGRDIILLDDIVTTGSTLTEAYAALRAAGARQIFPIAIAH